MHLTSVYGAPGLPICLQVEQFDTHSAATTVREALIFSGVLRNEKDVDMKTTLEFVDQVSTVLFAAASNWALLDRAGHCAGLAPAGAALRCPCQVDQHTAMHRLCLAEYPLLLLGSCSADLRASCVGDGPGGAADPVRGSCGDPRTVWAQCGAAQAPDHCCGAGEPCLRQPEMLQTCPATVCVAAWAGFEWKCCCKEQHCRSCMPAFRLQAAEILHDVAAACRLLPLIRSAACVALQAHF